jgi:hypothetical protein
MTHLTLPEVLDDLHRLQASRVPLGFDIEGGVGGITCCCFCPTPTEGLVIDLAGNPLNQAILLSALTEVLEDARVPKVCWNVAYERLILEWVHGIRLAGYHDAMFRWFERFSEPPKGLKYVSSLLTNRPFWAQGVKWTEDDDHAKIAGLDLWVYNFHDGASTIEIWNHPQITNLSPVQESRYSFNLSLIEPLNFAMLKGVRYDQKKATQFRKQLEPACYEAQAEVDRLAGITIPQGEALLTYIKENCCKKAAVKKGLITDLETAATYALIDYRDPLRRVRELMELQPSPAIQGELGMLLNLGINVKSNPQLAATLTKLGLPVSTKLKRLKGKEEDTLRQSADEEELLNLFLKTGHPFPKAVLKARAFRGYLQELDRQIDSDGRIRCSYSLLGTECISGDSYVFTQSGWRTIESIYSSTKAVKVWDGQKFVYPARKITHQDQPGFHITTEYGFFLKGTPNHPVMTRLGWKPLEQVEIGEKILIQIDYPHDSGNNVLPLCTLPALAANAKKITVPADITTALSELIGMWLADGNTHYGKNTYSVRFSNDDRDVQKRVAVLAKEVFNLDVSYTYTNDHRSDTTSINSKGVVEWFTAYGFTAKASQKSIPHWLMWSNESCVRALLRGLTLDTHFGPGKLFYGTQSPKMRSQIQLLLLRLGIVSAWTGNKLAIPTAYLGQFALTVGFVQGWKVKRLSDMLNAPHGALYYPEHTNKWVMVKSKLPWQGDVYDLSMPEGSPPQFYANGFLVHNTARVTSHRFPTGSGGNLQTVPGREIVLSN